MHMYVWIVCCVNVILFCDPDRCHAHTRTHTHTGHADLLTSPPQLGQQRTDLPGTRTAQRMTQGDGPTFGVDLLRRDSQLVGTPETLTGKRLVDLKDIDVGLLNAGQLVYSRNGFPRTDPHQERWYPDHGRRDIFAQDLLVQRLGRRSSHEQDGSGAVGDL